MDYPPYIKKLKERQTQEKTLAENNRQQALAAAREIATLLKRDFAAQRVILFGSTLSPERFHLRSDIDLAASGVPAKVFFKAYASALDLAQPFNLDLIDLNACRPTLHAKTESAMNIALTEVRPKVISENTQQELREFLSFRHAIRSIYVFDIASEPVITLATSVPAFFSKVKAELETFCAFLKTVGNGS